MTSSIAWGPDLTASSLFTTQTQSPDLQPGFSEGSKRLLLATTIIGGTFLMAFLIYAMYRLRRGAAIVDIVRFRARQNILSPGRSRNHFTALPIYRESRYSVHSSHYCKNSCASNARSPRRVPRPPIPSSMIKEIHDEGSYLKEWKTEHRSTKSETETPTEMQQTPKQTFLIDTTPVMPTPLTPELKPPPKAHVMEENVSAALVPVLRSKPDFMSDIREETSSTVKAHAGSTPPASPTSLHSLQDHWSWTNSQAPTTPRLYAPSRRSSTTSLPRFRSVTSWINITTRTADRISEEVNEPQSWPLPPLKNQATKPSLMPVTPKKHASKLSLSSIFRTNPGTKLPSSQLPPEVRVTNPPARVPRALTKKRAT